MDCMGLAGWIIEVVFCLRSAAAESSPMDCFQTFNAPGPFRQSVSVGVAGDESVDDSTVAQTPCHLLLLTSQDIFLGSRFYCTENSTSILQMSTTFYVKISPLTYTAGSGFAEL